jgi:hypothetical protein
MRALMVVLLPALVMVPLVAGAEQYGTIEELAAAYADDKCKACHSEIYGEWEATPHADSVNMALGGMRNFFVLGVKDWWKRDLTKAEVMKCLDCHAPVTQYATEALAVKIAGMVVEAQDAKDGKKKEEIGRELAKLHVGCVSCHNVKATAIAIGRRGEPVKDAVYGLRGKDSPGHRTVKSPELGTALFCMQCHGIYYAPDGETIGCNTISGSYQETYLSRGGSRTCQDCHMRQKGRGHRMMGGRDLALVKEGIGFNLEVSQYMHLPGKGEDRWTPSAIVNVELENRAGHRIPDG